MNNELITSDNLDQFPNLLDSTLGASIVAVSDEFFGASERLINPNPPIFRDGIYDENGKWMDGWETRRRRDNGHDWCVIRLAFPGEILAIEIDTSFFIGNAPIGAELEYALSPSGKDDDIGCWKKLTDYIPIKGNDRRFLFLDTPQICSHIRLHIYPDGGVARLRAYGVGRPLQDYTSGGEYDLVALSNGGRAIAWSDAHFGHPQNMLRQGPGMSMGDGWETRRRRDPGNDWCIIALGEPGVVERIDLDTAYFKGNSPAYCSIQAAHVDHSLHNTLTIPQSLFWETILAERALHANSMHSFSDVYKLGPITHLRLNIIPDGGVSRLRVFGNVLK